ncbi:MAG: hypothetical protein IPG02_11925 [Ignavibacteria bacterium]|nr:hypothetical protein [Ignavibacteria bacterium]
MRSGLIVEGAPIISKVKFVDENTGFAAGGAHRSHEPREDWFNRLIWTDLESMFALR